ncbi:hypothetical protein BD309DRAFT_704479 [Dichomitus squalens]|uniref:Uncharacterized protein n=1 Tax=Dichomitus squalens TaxID=114155 RepID=A0A4V2K4S7_9APHY|nr:uncharacterized protein DICSQDRAFT_167985 [Dichomitus squalens LYAD-421 SS1]EJF63938.1 hypothetical protein DICSQDRAFT_167985 [Dichomitus squalens LYAD-421 SS1]TBU31494.1 hypothetical protein BD311DRAFT_752708 [Dichomitus squalens]TBU45623.1 hypothetical protein BD309DRAFT_704479 [Dichomitus squalens]TBU58308.1 hypothetical protein BD310DRAFT_489192 [Dichomitus squalens]
MPSQTQKSDSSASSTKSIPPAQLISLPSLSCSLSSLPQAKSIDGLSLHPTMLAQHNAESQAKLQKALSKSAANANLPHAYAAPHPQPMQYSPSSNSPPLMMRKPTKTKIQV